jgi:hypothetical protein
MYPTCHVGSGLASAAHTKPKPPASGMTSAQSASSMQSAIAGERAGAEAAPRRAGGAGPGAARAGRRDAQAKLTSRTRAAHGSRPAPGSACPVG